jgi:hypothetical protein
MVVGQVGLYQHVHQHVELVIKFDRGKKKKKKKEITQNFLFLEIVPIQHHNTVVFIVLVQELIQFYVMFLMLLVQENNKTFC